MIDAVADRILKLLPILGKRRITLFVRALMMTGETVAGILYWILDLLSLDRIFSNLSSRLAEEKESYRYQAVAGSPEVIRKLSGSYKLAFCTAGGKQSAELFLKKYTLNDFISMVVTAESYAKTKPSPLPLKSIAAAFELSPENCLMVGDTIFDLIAAKRAGMHFIGVLSGFDSRFLLKMFGADVLIDSVTNLTDILPA